jgi:malate synthase
MATLVWYMYVYWLTASRNGPFFYLSKLETSSEAKLWAQIFDWSEVRLEMQHSSIK